MVGSKHHLGCPSRQNMVKAAILMERRGFTCKEWSVMARLCDSSAAIRGYILSFADECLNAFDGTIPHRGHRNCEIALIAAFNVYEKTQREIGRVSAGYIDSLLEPPEPWTQEQEEMAWEIYQANHPDNYRVSAKLSEVLEQEAAAIYREPYTSPAGCVVIPFGAAKSTRRVVQR